MTDCVMDDVRTTATDITGRRSKVNLLSEADYLGPPTVFGNEPAFGRSSRRQLPTEGEARRLPTRMVVLHRPLPALMPLDHDPRYLDRRPSWRDLAKNRGAALRDAVRNHWKSYEAVVVGSEESLYFLPASPQREHKLPAEILASVNPWPSEQLAQFLIAKARADDPKIVVNDSIRDAATKRIRDGFLGLMYSMAKSMEEAGLREFRLGLDNEFNDAVIKALLERMTVRFRDQVDFGDLFYREVSAAAASERIGTDFWEIRATSGELHLVLLGSDPGRIHVMPKVKAKAVSPFGE